MSKLAVEPETIRFRPIKVATIDVESCPEAIDGGRDYRALWALVRERGRPRGMIQVPFAGEFVGREQLTAAIGMLPPASAQPAPPRSQERTLPSISIVIPSLLERTEGLQACLRSLSELDYPDYEVIVVDNRPAAAARVELPGVRVVSEPRPGISAARNRGLEEARGEIVAFTDDDVEVDPGWLLAIGRRLTEHPEEACVTGLALPSELETPAQIALEEYYGGFGPRTFEPVSHRMRAPGGSSRLRPATVDAVGDDGRVRRSFSLYAAGSFGPGANMAFRTAILRRLGGFDLALGAGTDARGGEDLVMFARLAWRGYGVGFQPAAIVHHTHRRDEASLGRQIEGYGVGYGALLMALVLEDPRHLGRMLGTAGRAVRVMRAGYRDKLDARAQPNPRTRELARRELRGMATGPLVYLRSRLRGSR
jgi:glycosyltransferase involved in cell wall biosynthesis